MAAWRAALAWLAAAMVVAAAAAVEEANSSAAGAPDSWLNKFGTNLREELSGVLDEQEIHYYEPVINVTYISTSEFDMRAMGALYNSTGSVIDFIAKKQAYPEGIVSVSDGNVEVVTLSQHWRELVAHYAGPAAVLTLALLLVPALPLAGWIWCCCYFCRSGRRRRPFDRKYDACIKGILAIVLIALLTLFLFGVVCVFATEEQLETGVGGAGGAAAEAEAEEGAAGAVRRGVRDAQEFLNATQAHARWLLVDNYKQLEDHMLALVNSSGARVSRQLGVFSQAVAVSTLSLVVSQLSGVQSDLRAVQRLTSDLRYSAERLNAGLRKVRADLLNTLRTCDQPQCRRLQEKYRIGDLYTEIHYSQIPDVSELLGNVSLVVESDVAREVSRGHQVLVDVQRAVQRELDRHVPDTTRAITQVGDRLEQLADRITETSRRASARLEDDGGAARDALRHVRDHYAPYRRYAGLAVASALLLMTSLLACGLLCGVCGKRPDVYAAGDCCSKAHGARCLLCGIVMMFLLGGAAALLVAVYFAVGVTSQRFICDPLTETNWEQHNRLFSDLEEFVQLEQALYRESKDPHFNMSAVLRRCHRNQTIYVTLELQRVFDLESVQASVSRSLSQQLARLRPAGDRAGYRANGDVVILQPAAKEKLRRLTASGLSDFNFDRILEALETNMTSLSLEELARQLEATSRELRPRPGFTLVTADLQNCAAMLRTYQADLVLPMTRHTLELNETATRLRDGLRFNKSSLNEAVEHLMQETDQAEHFLNTQGPELVLNLTRSLGESISAPLEQYMSHVAEAARERVGKCGPLSHAYNSTRDALCRNILMPLNGYWMSVSWCLVLFVPLLVVAQRLARLYVHLDPYPGPLVEAEYLYDAYADRDNVPLANAYKAEKRSRREPRGGGGGAEVAGDGGLAAGAGGGAGAGAGGRGGEARSSTHVDAHHARRYNDMAPKHWEEGPPRYHGPTEYERPPPYYYPGPADRQ